MWQRHQLAAGYSDSQIGGGRLAIGLRVEDRAGTQPHTTRMQHRCGGVVRAIKSGRPDFLRAQVQCLTEQRLQCPDLVAPVHLTADIVPLDEHSVGPGRRGRESGE